MASSGPPSDPPAEASLAQPASADEARVSAAAATATRARAAPVALRSGGSGRGTVGMAEPFERGTASAVRSPWWGGCRDGSVAVGVDAQAGEQVGAERGQVGGAAVPRPRSLVRRPAARARRARPGDGRPRTATRSATWRASSTSWVTSRTVVGAASWIESRRSCIRIRVRASSAPNGSSSSSTPGRRARARAREARWAMPPEMARGRLVACSASPTRSSSSSTREVASARGVPRGRPRATFSRTDFHGISRGSWKATAQALSMPSTAWSPTRTRPSVGRSRPAAERSSVDLPQPLGPSRATTSPAATWRSTPRSTALAPRPVPKVRPVPSKRSGRAVERAAPSGRVRRRAPACVRTSGQRSILGRARRAGPAVPG